MGKLSRSQPHFAAEIDDVFLGILRRMASTPTRAGGATAACRSECVRFGAEATDPAPMCRSLVARSATLLRHLERRPARDFQIGVRATRASRH